MGFGFLFLGVMFLFDSQIALTESDSGALYGIVDLFPDVIGWILLFFGLNALGKKESGFALLRRSALILLVLSLVSLAKDTLFFSSFYEVGNGKQGFAGNLLDDFEHLATLFFLFVLYRKTSYVCHVRGEEKLSRFHALVPKLCEDKICLKRLMSNFPSLSRNSG